ncbi:uncharacterized protein N7487_007843 [Penicillium crustosum]|uniref:uncharacterized protein n=1 Tax=Penicillium crustosum TaxID=36656 RepID=UPI00238B2508|nr:uncharacterized protein N7487_007843 [Penicillium crustosum]KAJ5401947.1 hypothetical protein N7487_007843 [Penicillium crustosum]
MRSFALRGYRSSQHTFFRGYAPRHTPGFRGKMGGLLKIALLGTCTYFVAKKISHANQSPPHASSNYGSQSVQPVPQ